MKLSHLSLITLASLTLAACGSVAVAPTAREVQFGAVEEVFEGAGEALMLCGELPLVFLVGDAASAPELLAARARLVSELGADDLALVLDTAALDSLERTSLSDLALEAALEVEGVILLDDSGLTARSLTGGSPGPRLVRVDAQHLVTAELNYASADDAALAALFSSEP